MDEREREFDKIKDEHRELKQSIAGDQRRRQKEIEDEYKRREEFESKVAKLEKDLEQATTGLATQKQRNTELSDQNAQLIKEKDEILG